ncbi:MAG: hypothetical protein ABJG68_10190 [Crocinitomicaceae bacterium]
MKWIFSIILFIGGYTMAQEQNFVFEDTINEDNLIKISSYNTYSSNRLNNEFMDKFLFGGEITTEMKDKASSKMKQLNAIGGEFEQRIDSYTPSINMFKKENLGMKLSFSDNHYFSGNFSTDLFNTAMYGNANYIGDTMKFTFSHAQYMHYQKFGVGFYNESNLSSVQISYVSGSKALEFGLGEAYMVSRTDMDTIDVKANGQGYITDTLNPYWAFQGGGFAIDIDYNFIFEGKVKNRQIINFKVSNLGMIFWNKKTVNYNLAANGTYSGVDISELLNQDSTQDNSINWQDTLNITESVRNKVATLPLELVVQKLPDNGIDAKLQAIFGFKTILVPDYFPYIYAGAYYRPVEQFSLSSRLSYGGFAGIRWGLNVNYWVKDKLYFGAGTFDMIGLISKKVGFGRGVNFSMYYKL